MKGSTKIGWEGFLKIDGCYELYNDVWQYPEKNMLYCYFPICNDTPPYIWEVKKYHRQLVQKFNNDLL